MKKLIFYLSLFWSFAAHAENALNTKAIDEIISSINQQYLYDVDNSKLISKGLTALPELDENIIIYKGSDSFFLYYKNNLIQAVSFPQDNSDISGWINSVTQILENAIQFSENASLRDFELADIIAKKMVKSLDEYSHYYSEFDYTENDGKNAIYTLYSDRIIEDILYLRVRIFNKQTAQEIQRSLEKHPNTKGVILDLRGNSGGMLNEALKTADLFTDNEIITYTAARNDENIHYYTSEEGELFNGPMVVLVDGETASAAEVIAAGLQEQSRAKIIGTSTFGKGTIQNIVKINNGSKLVLTTEQFFTPSGKIIHEIGVTPDICTIDLIEGKCPRTSRLDNDADIDTAVDLLWHRLP